MYRCWGNARRVICHGDTITLTRSNDTHLSRLHIPFRCVPRNTNPAVALPSFFLFSGVHPVSEFSVTKQAQQTSKKKWSGPTTYLMGFDGVQLWLGYDSNSNRTQTATASGLYSFLMTYHKRHLGYYVCQFHLSSAAPNCPGPWKPQRRKKRKRKEKKKNSKACISWGFAILVSLPPSGIGCQLSRLWLGRFLFDGAMGGLSWSVCALRRSRGMLPISDCSCVSVSNMKHLGYSDVYG